MQGQPGIGPTLAMAGYCRIQRNCHVMLEPKRRWLVLSAGECLSADMPACGSGRVWEWKSGHGVAAWTVYPNDVRAKLDAAVLASSKKSRTAAQEVSISEFHYVDLGRMRQLRRDDPTQSRAVRTRPVAADVAGGGGLPAAETLSSQAQHAEQCGDCECSRSPGAAQSVCSALFWQLLPVPDAHMSAHAAADGACFALCIDGLEQLKQVHRMADPWADPAATQRCVVQDSNLGHQLLLPPANWCPIFASRTT